MPRTRTLSEMRTECRQRTEQEGSQFVSDNELDRYLNQSCAKLWGKLVRARGDQYYQRNFPITTVPGAISYDLPADFFRLMGVDLQENGLWRSLEPIDWSRRAIYLNAPLTGGRGGLVYNVTGDKLSLLPVVASALLLVVHYIPQAPIVSDAVPFDGISGWEHYAILDTCIAMLAKEESDTRDLRLERDDIEARIDELSSARDDGAAPRTQKRYRGRR